MLSVPKNSCCLLGLLLTFFVSSFRCDLEPAWAHPGFLPEGKDTIDGWDNEDLRPVHAVSEDKVHHGASLEQTDPMSRLTTGARSNGKKMLVKYIPVVEEIKVRKYKLILTDSSDSDIINKKYRFTELSDGMILGSISRDIDRKKLIP